MAKLQVEIWTSSANQEEHHYFLIGQVQGHEPNMYLFGINPKYFSEDKIKKVLEVLELA
jgi:hypothetical protein